MGAGRFVWEEVSLRAERKGVEKTTRTGRRDAKLIRFLLSCFQPSTSHPSHPSYTLPSPSSLSFSFSHSHHPLSPPPSLPPPSPPPPLPPPPSLPPPPQPLRSRTPINTHRRPRRRCFPTPQRRSPLHRRESPRRRREVDRERDEEPRSREEGGEGSEGGI